MGRERNRRGIRLAGFDYTQPGVFFLTICAARRECLFGVVNDGVMHRNAIGDVVADTWHALPQRFCGVTLDAFVVMPNHIHGVLCIENRIVNGRGAACCAPDTNSSRSAKSLADVVRAFKSMSAIAANQLLRRQGQPLWQRNYYERIIRNESELSRIREYVVYNPARWDDDNENPSRERT